jgi:hypothetical protein
MKTEREVVCDSCGVTLLQFNVPEPGDEEGWSRVREQHREGCEWLAQQQERRAAALAK